MACRPPRWARGTPEVARGRAELSWGRRRGSAGVVGRCRSLAVPSPGRWVFAGTLVVLGVETVFTAFLVGILELKREGTRAG